MNTLQTSIIQNYRKIYPDHTLKEISNLTGIQLTRVFRILNGSEMKLSEYSAFTKITSRPKKRISALFDECLQKLSDMKLKEISKEIESLLKMQSTITKSTRSEYVQYNTIG